MNENEISKKVIGLAIEVHRKSGPGLLERAYKECLFYKIIKDDLAAEKEKAMPLIFEEVKLECGYILRTGRICELIIRVSLINKKRKIIIPKCSDSLLHDPGGVACLY